METAANIRARLAKVEDNNIATLEDNLLRIEGMRQALMEAADEVRPPVELLEEWYAQLDATEADVRRVLAQARAQRQIMLVGRLHEVGQA